MKRNKVATPYSRPRGGLLPSGLSISAGLAIDMLAEGSSIADAARQSNISRYTISKWLKHNPVFQAELNGRREDARRARQAGRAALVSSVEAAVVRAMADPDTPNVVILQSGLAFLAKIYGLPEAQDAGQTDARKIAEAMRPFGREAFDGFSYDREAVEELLAESEEELQDGPGEGAA